MIDTANFGFFEGNKKQYLEFIEKYNIDIIYIPPNGNENTKNLPPSLRSCRFCGKRMPEVRFKSKAHIIPNNVFGNNYGYSDHECDTCNNFFSLFETNMSAYLGLSRSVHSLSNKKIPKYISPVDQLSARPTSAFNKSKVLQINDQGKKNIILNEDGKTIEITFFKQTYIPYSAYKCLLKIGLSLLSEIDIKPYNAALEFLMNNRNEHHFSEFAKVLITQLPQRMSKPYCVIFKKKKPSLHAPSHIMQLYFHDNMYQIVLPLNREDMFLIKKNTMEVQFCPPLLAPSFMVKGKCQNRLIPFNTSVPVENEKSVISIRLDEDFKVPKSFFDISNEEGMNIFLSEEDFR